MTSRWLNYEDYLPVRRSSVIDWATDKLIPPRVFAPNDARLFDLAMNTLSVTNQMHRRLTDIWAENHPLLRQNVRLTELQRVFRAFHRYMTEALLRSNRKVRTALHDAREKEQLNSLQNHVHDERLHAAVLRRHQDEIDEEIRELRLEMDRLQNSMDPGNEYLSELIKRKHIRLQILQQETRAIRTSNEKLQSDLARTLNRSLSELMILGDALASRPDLFVGRLTKKEQIAVALPTRPDLGPLPDQLFQLYQELYELMGETTVRELIRDELLETPSSTRD